MLKPIVVSPVEFGREGPSQGGYDGLERYWTGARCWWSAGNGVVVAFGPWSSRGQRGGLRSCVFFQWTMVVCFCGDFSVAVQPCVEDSSWQHQLKAVWQPTGGSPLQRWSHAPSQPWCALHLGWRRSNCVMEAIDRRIWRTCIMHVRFM